MWRAMTLAEYLKTTRTTQDALGLKVGLTQGRISQIVEKGTRDLATAKKIEDATGGQVKWADLVPEHWREALEGAPAETGDAA